MRVSLCPWPRLGFGDGASRAPRSIPGLAKQELRLVPRIKLGEGKALMAA